MEQAGDDAYVQKGRAMMLCPYCLNEVRFDVADDDIISIENELKADGKIPGEESVDMFEDTDASGDSTARAAPPLPRGKTYRCPQCKEVVPAAYVRGYVRYPPVIVNTVGHAAHGKTVYLHSLLRLLRRGELAPMWPDFHCTALDEFSLTALSTAGRDLDEGRLPPPTQQVFPRPVLLRLKAIPSMADSTLAIYDASGEAYKTVSRMGQYARFISHARFKLFLISISKLREGKKDVAVEIDEHLDRYRLGMEALGANTKEQDLIIVYTMADELTDVRENWEILREYVLKDDLRGLSKMRRYMYGMHLASQLASVYTARGLGAMQVVAKARHEFRSVRFFMVSALGARPRETIINGERTKRLDHKPVPRRVIDPLLACLPRRQEQ